MASVQVYTIDSTRVSVKQNVYKSFSPKKLKHKLTTNNRRGQPLQIAHDSNTRINFSHVHFHVGKIFKIL